MIKVPVNSVIFYLLWTTPLNIIPTWIVQILQTGVAHFFAEGLEGRGPPPWRRRRGRLGLENATLNPNASSDIPYPTSSNDDVETAATSYVETAASDSGSLLQTDELCDITVRFPEGQLSVVTGPSASGKTALLNNVMSKDTSRINENGYLHAISTQFNLRD
ncbi:hypothetical protein K443DRAFT_684502 [Laccaria amethystina LaAM-08-1]|uniref:ABC transporter domain-containing protein n=1 Tax=Laccaria amethystina LaAM-08-1 TaxID=1095629 RepID=A0A0C9X7F9_9AGAR|nr:hypothetical protein K443DRAFT_684502 [Laccaria amethystina LaAM-08-1]